MISFSVASLFIVNNIRAVQFKNDKKVLGLGWDHQAFLQGRVIQLEKIIAMSTNF